MVITTNAFISGTLNSVDSVVANFVQTAYQDLIQSNAIPITLIFTFYVMWLGYRFTYHTLAADMSTITRHLVVMLMIYALIMNWALYNTFVYNIFTNEPQSIAQVFFNATGQSLPGGSVAAALDNYFASSMKAVNGLTMQANFSNLYYLFYAGAVFIIALLLCAFSLVLFIYAKAAMAVILALGPLFITFILWDSTKELFAAWLRQLINFALIPIVTSTLVALMLSILNDNLTTMQAPASQIGFSTIVTFCTLTLVTGLLLMQVNSICSSLSAGVTLSGISQTLTMAATALKASGLRTAGKLGYKATKAGAQKVVGGIQRRRAENRRQAAEATTNKRYEGMV